MDVYIYLAIYITPYQNLRKVLKNQTEEMGACHTSSNQINGTNSLAKEKTSVLTCICSEIDIAEQGFCWLQFPRKASSMDIHCNSNIPVRVDKVIVVES